MFIRIKTTPNSPRRSVQIVQSCRTGDVVKQKIVRHIGIAEDAGEEAQLVMMAESIKIKLEAGEQQLLFPPEKLAQLAKTENKLTQPSEEFEVNLKNLAEEQRLVAGVHDIYGSLFDELGLAKIFEVPSRAKNMVEVFKNILLARIANPVSKRASVDMLEENFGISIDLNKVYRMMDMLDEKAVERLNGRVYDNTAALLGGKIDVVFFDATTVYFEAFEADELRRMGYSKDLIFNQPQVLLSLMVTKEGLPLGYQVFPGSVYEGHTVLTALESIKKRTGGIGRVVFVADAGMLREENLKLLADNNFEYIVGARLRNMSAAQKEEILKVSNYSLCAGGARVARLALSDNNWLVVSHTEKRAAKDRHNREAAIERLKNKLAGNKTAKAFTQSSCRRYLNINGGTISLNEEKIKADAAWDGLHGVVTNAKDMDNNMVLEQYKNLWQVEEAFRITKHDLKVRPVYHWNPARVRAHFAIAFAAYTLVKHMEYRVKLQYEKLSPERIRQILTRVQTTILFDTKQRIRYALPSKMTQEAKKIYQIFRKQRSLTPQIIGKIKNK